MRYARNYALGPLTLLRILQKNSAWVMRFAHNCAVFSHTYAINFRIRKRRPNNLACRCNEPRSKTCQYLLGPVNLRYCPCQSLPSLLNSRYHGHLLASHHFPHPSFSWGLVLACGKCSTRWVVCTLCSSMRKHMIENSSAP